MAPNAPFLPNSCEVDLKNDLVIYTSTFYDGKSEESNVRAKICIQFLENIEKLWLKCVLAEGWSTNANFLEQLKKFQNITVIKSHVGIWEDRRNALQKAIEENPNTPYYMWVEPEKDDLISEETLRSLVLKAKENEFDIVVPKRSNESTWRPKFQEWIENRANKRVFDELKKRWIDISEILDLWFWSKLFTKAWAQYFLDYKSDLDKWDSIIKPVVDALEDGKKVWSIEVDYHYDTTQTENESHEDNREIIGKRVFQYNRILREILWNEAFIAWENAHTSKK